MESPRTRATAGSGFTLLEAMMAIGILAFGLLTLAVMQLQALHQESAGRHTADAAATARTYLEQVARLPWSELDTAAAAGTWTAPSWPGAQATVNVAMDAPGGAGLEVEHSYSVLWRVADVVEGGTPNPCLRDVSVRVTWTERQRSAPKTLDLTTRRYNWGAGSC